MPGFEFAHKYSYASDPGDISLPIFLSNGDRSFELVASVDTGASHCLFERLCADWLDLDVEAGERRVFRTGAGPLVTFGHHVQITTFDLIFESQVYFFADPAVNKNLLGRVGWLDRMRVGIVDHDRELYLSAYDDHRRT